MTKSIDGVMQNGKKNYSNGRRVPIVDLELDFPHVVENGFAEPQKYPKNIRNQNHPAPLLAFRNQQTGEGYNAMTLSGENKYLVQIIRYIPPRTD